MGLVKEAYEVPELGVTVQNAYAKIVVISSEQKGQSVATLQIRKTREDFDDVTMQPIKQISIPFVANKNLPLWEQGYTEAKNTVHFAEWFDDIQK